MSITRYCCSCSHIGPVEHPALACCPESRGEMVYTETAEQAKLGFAALYLTKPGESLTAPSAQAAEIERLTQCLKTANAQSEEFERKWYLAAQQLEDRQAEPPQPAAPTDARDKALIEFVQNGIADFIADNWPDRKHDLTSIERGIRRIEIRLTAADRERLAVSPVETPR
jgi:hypothetical protein